MSNLVALSPASAFNLIRPCASNKRSALASFVASLGTAIVAPSFNSSMDFVFPA